MHDPCQIHTPEKIPILNGICRGYIHMALAATPIAGHMPRLLSLLPPQTATTVHAAWGIEGVPLIGTTTYQIG
jgi:hypothetical protein